MKPLKSIHALAATARIANVPSVVSNVWLGVVLGSCQRSFDGTALHATVLLVGSGVCLYLAGNFLNDWADRAWDATHRPERALPGGVFQPKLYLTIAGVLGCIGLGLAGIVNSRSLCIAAVIALSILIYTRTHKRSVWSVVPMGLCRALLPVLGYIGIVGSHVSSPENRVVAGCALGLFFHIVGLSFSARSESARQSGNTALHPSALLFLMTVFSVWASAAYFGLPPALCAIGLFPYVAWTALCLTAFRAPVSSQVSNLLAGIPLVDWMLLWPIFLLFQAFGGNHEPFYLACFWISPLAFLAGKALQRLAPAT